MDLHPACEPLAFLLGTWIGGGSGHYPSIASFTYTEHVEFSHVGKPFLHYAQRTRDAESGQPLHAETGYLRAVDAADGHPGLELILAQPSGIVEIHSGVLDDNTLRFTPTLVATSPSAKSVTDVTRTIVHDRAAGTLTYDVAMAAVGHPLTHHLHAVLNLQP